MNFTISIYRARSTTIVEEGERERGREQKKCTIVWFICADSIMGAVFYDTLFGIYVEFYVRVEIWRGCCCWMRYAVTLSVYRIYGVWLCIVCFVVVARIPILCCAQQIKIEKKKKFKHMNPFQGLQSLIQTHKRLMRALDFFT